MLTTIGVPTKVEGRNRVFDLLVSDSLRLLHLLAVAIGFGVAIESEIYMICRRKSPISHGMIQSLHHRHRIVLIAVGAMWVTGFALIALRTGLQLSAFTPKLWAKLSVVMILTANAALIAEVALPMLKSFDGKRLGDLPIQAQRALYSVAGISAASWFMAFTLGSSVILKTGPAPLFQIVLPTVYIAGILAANLVAGRVFSGSGQSVHAADVGEAVRRREAAKVADAAARAKPGSLRRAVRSIRGGVETVFGRVGEVLIHEKPQTMPKLPPRAMPMADKVRRRVEAAIPKPPLKKSEPPSPRAAAVAEALLRRAEAVAERTDKGRAPVAEKAAAPALNRDAARPPARPAKPQQSRPERTVAEIRASDLAIAFADNKPTTPRLRPEAPGADKEDARRRLVAATKGLA
ncbi:MAG: hypothetical protein AAF871_00740 [Pseudomonadota bacterium]